MSELTRKGNLMPDYVSKTDCRRRHNRIWQVCISLIGVFMLATSWAVVAGYGAQRKVDVHSAAAMERDKAIGESLDRIEAAQIRMDGRLDAIYKQNGG